MENTKMFKLDLKKTEDADMLEIGFVGNYTNPDLVKYVHEKLPEIVEEENMGGKLLKITGPCSLPIAFVISHIVTHLYSMVAIYDPKLEGFVIVSSHGGIKVIGDII